MPIRRSLPVRPAAGAWLVVARPDRPFGTQVPTVTREPGRVARPGRGPHRASLRRRGGRRPTRNPPTRRGRVRPRAGPGPDRPLPTGLRSRHRLRRRERRRTRGGGRRRPDARSLDAHGRDPDREPGGHECERRVPGTAFGEETDREEEPQTDHAEGTDRRPRYPRWPVRVRHLEREFLLGAQARDDGQVRIRWSHDVPVPLATFPNRDGTRTRERYPHNSHMARVALPGVCSTPNSRCVPAAGTSTWKAAQPPTTSPSVQSVAGRSPTWN